MDSLSETARDPRLAGIPMQYCPSPPEHGFNRLGYKFSRLSRPVLESYYELTALRRILASAVRFGRDNGVEMVLAPLHSPSTIHLAKPLAEALGVPLIVIVWDPPEYFLPYSYEADSWTARRILGSFEATMRHAKRCCAASRPMKASYERRFGTECVVIIYNEWLAPSARAVPPEDAGRPVVISYAGYLYARDAWEALISALSSTGWRIAGRDACIRVLGSSIEQKVSGPVRIEFLGFANQVQVQKLLSKSDIGYVAHWFDEGHRMVPELSFPSKLAAYVAARVPVLFHGPRYGSACEFLERFPVGLACNSLSKEDILSSLERLACDRALQSRASAACDDAFQQELSFGLFRRRFAEFVGVSPDSLRSVDEALKE
jgi:hypothetical protein